MKIAPLSWNLIAGSSLLSGDVNFAYGQPFANIYDSDPLTLCVFRGAYHVTAGVNDKIDFNDGSARVATLAAATYWSPAEYGIEVARAMNAVSTNCRCWLSYASATRYRFIVDRSAGSLSLECGTGANAATNALVKQAGFRAQDRASGTSHTGDFVAIHGIGDTIALYTPRCTVAVDLASAKMAEATIIANPYTSPAASFSVAMGSTIAVSDATMYAGNSHDDSAIWIDYSTPRTYRYVSLRISDPHRDNYPRIGAGYWYHGRVWNSERVGASAGDFSNRVTHTMTPRYSSNTGIAGNMFVVEVEPGETFATSFDASPGVDSSGGPSIEELIRALGSSAYAFVQLDSAEPNRETWLCRLTEAPTVSRGPISGKAGRITIDLSWERVS